MPRGDGTGPAGQGAGTGRGQGGGGGRGRMAGNRPGSGPGGNCVCPSCSAVIGHQVGMLCNQIACPKCGANMVKQ
jgi:uncharacterized protein